jgi:hypothetical protein
MVENIMGKKQEMKKMEGKMVEKIRKVMVRVKVKFIVIVIWIILYRI